MSQGDSAVRPQPNSDHAHRHAPSWFADTAKLWWQMRHVRRSSSRSCPLVVLPLPASSDDPLGAPAAAPAAAVVGWVVVSLSLRQGSRDGWMKAAAGGRFVEEEGVVRAEAEAEAAARLLLASGRRRSRLSIKAAANPIEASARRVRILALLLLLALCVTCVCGVARHRSMRSDD